MNDDIEQRLAAVERALTDDDHDLSALAAEGETAARLQAVEDDLETLQETVADLEAATQALRGYVGNVKSVNDDVRERADLALETAEQAREAAAADEPMPDDTATAGATDADAGQRPDNRQRPAGEPTLELATDEGSARQPTAASATTDAAHSSPTDSSGSSTVDRNASSAPDLPTPSATDQCPLCDGDTEHGPASGQRNGTGRGRDGTPDRGSRHQAREDRQSVTDGGLVPDDEGSADGTDATVLARIRALL